MAQLCCQSRPGANRKTKIAKVGRRSTASQKFAFLNGQVRTRWNAFLPTHSAHLCFLCYPPVNHFLCLGYSFFLGLLPDSGKLDLKRSFGSPQPSPIEARTMTPMKTNTNRREFLRTSAAAGLAAV